ncbi:DNA ligase I [Leishmania donovani]|uniref:DNA ligase n=3 Tax=Leishmania donovani species complex TaxID=38574 RepID=A0A6L0XK99_LEIIN|nr:DNA_ligase_I_-_putative [Leishmania infantum]CAJ1991142.1 DNA ligase I [Leishmania donovani]SUZ44168.1 DNA_ligase_I_-_putative [Leishmania infantum]VDZ46989.1 DNA_ligase_I_putative/GeneDB:LmjF.30.3440 [Leishmania donovani]
MRQTTFERFVEHKAQEGGPSGTAAPREEGKKATTDANREDRKRPREEEKVAGSYVSSTPASNAASRLRTSWNEPTNAYYAQHVAEYKALVADVPPPTATSMAKLFQESSFDPVTTFEAVWLPPRVPVAPPTAGASEPVPFAAVVDVLADISATGSRLECLKQLTFLLLAVIERCPEDLVPVMYLVINKHAPQHEGVELGIGDAVLVKAVAECCGMTEARAKEAYRQSGDLAEIAQMHKQKQSTLMKPKPLSARSVFKTYKEIAMMSGRDVMRRRSDLIKGLLRDAQGPEVNLIVRGLQQKMRIGLAEPSALAAVGYAFALHFLGGAQMHKMDEVQLQTLLNTGADSLARIFYEVPSLDVVLSAVLANGFMTLVPGSSIAKRYAKDLSIRPGLPVKPQLAYPTSSITVILDRLQGKKFTSEYKYDGERAQIHYDKDKGFHIFSRNSETHTGKYPDVISMLPKVFDPVEVQSFILDSEVVAVHPETGALQAFQVLQHRGRKNIAEEDVSIPVCVFVFDILYFNGEPQLNKTLQQRRELLWRCIHPLPAKLSFATYLDSDKVEDMQTFLERSIADGCEGLMVKTLDEEANYTPAKRSHYWLKLKKDYMDGVTDTLDLVPIAAFHGKGKRTGVFGGFLLACYDPKADEYQSICKIGTGFQDEELEKLTQSLKPFVVDDKPRYYRAGGEEPDVWLTEAQVWEVKAADLSVSPVHQAAVGLVDPSKGIALRFPRYLRQREDKKPADATNAQQVADMYKAQSLAVQHEANGDAE